MLNRRRNNRRRAEPGERWQLPALPWRRLGAIAAAIGVVAAIGGAALLLLNQPIESIRVEGRFQHLSALDVEKLPGTDGLSTTDLRDKALPAHVVAKTTPFVAKGQLGGP